MAVKNMCYFTFKIYRSKGNISDSFTVRSVEAKCCREKVRDLGSKAYLIMPFV